MAYNPFNIFRRNQKAIFAVITVFIMFTFVLSSGLRGGADFFDWLPRWIGQKSRKGDVVCTIDGTKIYYQPTRAIAIPARHGQPIHEPGRLRGTGRAGSVYKRSISPPQPRGEGGHDPGEPDGAATGPVRQNPMLLYAGLNRIRGMLVPLLDAPTTKPADKSVIRAKLAGFLLWEHIIGGEQYFINAPNRTERDRINFMLWQQKADQLGIQFTTDDVKRLIQSEFYDAFKPEADVRVRKQLQQSFANFNMDKCFQAIGEEFRVRMAQVAVLGPGWHGRMDKTFGGPPIFSPAYEVFDYYRDQTSPTFYEVVAVPGANFLNKVVGEPTEAELKKLYDEYQNQEYDPALERPGFKIPRKVKLEWVSATGTEPYYMNKAREKLKNEELQRAVGVLGAIRPLGGTPVVIPPVARPWAVDSLADKYAAQIEAEHNRKIKDWGGFFGDRQLLDTSVVRAPSMAAAAGGLAGGQLTLGGPLPGLVLFDTAASAMERRDRIKAGMPLFLGTIPGPSMMATAVGAEAAARTMLPKPLPIAAVRAELLKSSVEQTAKKLMEQDLTKFRDALANLSGKRLDVSRAATLFLGMVPGPEMFTTAVASEMAYQKMATYVADMIASRGWQHGQSTALHDEWTLENDPGLASLKAALPKAVHGNEPIRFGKKFFWVETFPGDPTKTPATGTYQPEFYPSPPSQFASPEAKAEPTFLVWRTEETPAKAPGSFGQVRDEVIAAWKRIKARRTGQGPGGEAGQSHSVQRRRQFLCH